MDVNDKTLTELVRLTSENNRMLHKMRRRAIWGGVFKFIFYLLILVIAPLWIYTTYFAPLVQQFTNTMSQVQGTGAKVQAQFDGWQEAWKQFESKLPFVQQKQ